MAAVDGTGAYTDLAALGQLRREARTQDPETVREAARQFESLFTRMLLKSMREASFGDSVFDSGQTGFYRDMFDDQLAVELSRGKGLGLAEMLVQQLKQAGLVQGGENVAGQIGALSGPRALGSAVGAAFAAGTPSATASRDGWRSGQPGQFVRELWPHAERAGRELGVDPQAVLAQAALETGWGRSLPCGPDGRCSLNLFGIKAGDRWSGDAVAARTVEFDGGSAVAKTERFRAYDSAAESFRDYARLLKGEPRYASALGAGGDVQAFAAALVRGGYATDPDYASKLSRVAAAVAAEREAQLKSSDGRPMDSGGSAG
ncbi:MAG: flagellar assembly peptidoglycan hydrolase FlgJ [Gammaproteobacteria bacterium]|nr:flagellar assembly peptidoglycan hydrolase FlgJ [Gammaproteobacteria bacterium]